MNRRKFIQNTALSGLGLTVGASVLANEIPLTNSNTELNINNYPLVIATWDVKNATAKAWDVLQKGGSAMDAVEKGCNVEEEDPANSSVGYGGLPDREGKVTLDACIMDEKGNYGSVVFLHNIVNAISVARKVMEKTPHVLLAGKGAEEFALSQGFKSQNLLTENAKKAWEEWKVKSEYKPIINIENHDTIGMLTMDKNGNLSGGCTTSGLAFKMHGRVGDSPIIGSGLFVDNEIGAATATGLGEEVLKTVGSFLVVELMRQGKTPQQACEEAVHRIMKKQPDRKDFQVGYIAVNKKGEIGAYAIHPGFSYTVYQNGQNNNVIPKTYFS
ncbi:N(4)-(beta-N-acetylglucosaminyl)-L-asparaginase [Moheibacter sediminis]|uniref:N4-(Beta-N-acetylglucosaminyl)-L-asparaginase n=1 Tax=Moheibacter sediminis TaxID=1434700 RepID=A0A1W1ZQX3_9FLAO|nr:N(4)-(beta-N-acetylglucosaminyl)-L-asparaginase [Moheibacter sediminis]SMC50592.1 N4-(beta-N-acetylglucosaminyl)-L-asparaginase [Moheibacter sediminis]